MGQPDTGKSLKIFVNTSENAIIYVFKTFKIFSIRIKRLKCDAKTLELLFYFIFLFSVVSELNNGTCCITWPPPKCFVKQEIAQEEKSLSAVM